MKAVLVFALLLASVSALSRLQKMRVQAEAEDTESEAEEWDIAEGITGAGAMGKVEGHERSVKEAWNGLSAADKSQITNPTKPQGRLAMFHNPTDMIMGVQYPDMPIGGRSVTALGDDLTKPDHVTAGTFGALFKAGGLGARNSFIAQTHYGCLQFWHAMAPEPYVGGKYKVWTNAALSGLIKASTRRIWDVAVNKLKAGNKGLAEFHLGRILHTIGDSYAKGHTVRAPSSCGRIAVFQEYNAQKGNEHHASGDKPNSNMDTFRCTVQRVKEVLQAWAGCVRTRGNCRYPTIIDSTFDVLPEVANLDAGGSEAAFAGPLAKSKGTKKEVKAGGKTITVYFPEVKGARIAGTSSVAQACPRF